MGIAYDVFGNGKTAVKVNWSKYLQSAANDGVYINANKASTFAQTANRAWTDGNKNFVARLRPEEPGGAGQPRGGRRPVRRAGQRELLRVLAESLARHGDHREPGAPERLGRASVRLAVQRVGAAADRAARVGGSSATAAARGATSPTPTTARVAAADFDTYTMTVPTTIRGCRTAASRSRSALLNPSGAGPGGQLPHARQRLRRRDRLLAGRRAHGQRADQQRTDAAGRLHHRRRHARQLRGHREGSPNCSSCSASSRRSRRATCEEPWLAAWRGLVNYTVPKIDVQVSGILRSTAEHLGDQRPGVERRVGDGQPDRAEQRRAAGARPAARGQRAERDGQLGVAG